MSQGRKATVKSLVVHGLGKKIYRSGDVVFESNFPTGNFDKLIKENHLLLASGQTEVNAGKSFESELEKAKAQAKLEKEAEEKAAADLLAAAGGGDAGAAEKVAADLKEKEEKEAAEKVAQDKASAEKEFEEAKLAVEAYKGGKKFTNSKNVEVTVSSPADITVKELIKELESAELEFNHIAPKVVLFSKWIAL